MLHGHQTRRLHEFIIKQGCTKAYRKTAAPTSFCRKRDKGKRPANSAAVISTGFDLLKRLLPQSHNFYSTFRTACSPTFRVYSTATVTKQASNSQSEQSCLFRPWGENQFNNFPTVIRHFMKLVDVRHREANIWNAWNVFLQIEAENLSSKIPPPCILDYTHALFAALADGASPPRTTDSRIAIASRLNHLLDLLEQYCSYPPFEHTAYFLRSAALLELGEYNKARNAILPIRCERAYGSDYQALETLTLFVRSYLAQKEAIEKTVELVLQFWDVIFLHVYDVRRGPMDHRTKLAGNRLRYSVFEALDSIEDPVVWIAEHSVDWNPDELRRTVQLFLLHLINRDKPTEALKIYRVAAKMPRPEAPKIHGRIVLKLVRALASEHDFDGAKFVLDLYSPPSPSDFHYSDYLCTSLHLAASKGNVDEANMIYNMLPSVAKESPYAQSLLLMSHDRNKDIAGLLKQWHRFHSSSTRPPHPSHFQAIIQAYAKRGDLRSVNEWLNKFYDAGHSLTLGVCTAIMKVYVQNRDVRAAAKLLESMKKLNLCPDNVFYTLIIALLADRGDPVAAERVLRLVRTQGLQPDARMLNTLMDAHVQAGSWAGVIQVFDYIDAQRRKTGGSYSISIFNVLLKALVRIGAPFHVVADYWRKLELINLKPSAHTWCLLVQSACDAGRTDIAIDILGEMDKLSDEIGNASHVDAFVLTSIMSAFLRKGDNARAKEAYGEMIDRGIQPLATTFGKIIQAYALDGSENSLKLAEEFLEEVKQSQLSQLDWTLPAGNATTFEAIYNPLMAAYGRQMQVADVERLYNSMLDQGGEGTISILTLLMDAYRRSGDIEGVQHIWPQLLDRVTGYSKNDELLTSINKSNQKQVQLPSLKEIRGNKLCVALSVYLDALSWAGLHADIAAVWKQVRDAGFAFDPSNWNHLSCALVRAGEPERAFEVVERVLLPFDDWLKNEKNRQRDRNPKDIFIFDMDDKISSFEEFSSYSEGLSHDRRVAAQKLAEARILRRDSVSLDEEQMDDAGLDSDLSLLEKPEVETSTGNDFARPLFVLSQSIPTWDMWRPHIATLTHLSWAVAQLSGGRMLRPFQPTVSEDVDYSKNYREEDIQQERVKAHDKLDDIHLRFPRTISLIRQWSGTPGATQHIRKLAQRLGGIESRYWYNSDFMRQTLE